jgi:hypothetical protein
VVVKSYGVKLKVLPGLSDGGFFLLIGIFGGGLGVGFVVGTCFVLVVDFFFALILLSSVKCIHKISLKYQYKLHNAIISVI